MVLSVRKDIFLSNPVNKQSFVKYLSEVLQTRGCKTVHAVGDADTLIVQTAVSCSAETTIVIGEDTDLLVLLCFHQCKGSWQSKEPSVSFWQKDDQATNVGHQVAAITTWRWCVSPSSVRPRCCWVWHHVTTVRHRQRCTLKEAENGQNFQALSTHFSQPRQESRRHNWSGWEGFCYPIQRPNAGQSGQSAIPALLWESVHKYSLGPGPQLAANVKCSQVP